MSAKTQHCEGIVRHEVAYLVKCKRRSAFCTVSVLIALLALFHFFVFFFSPSLLFYFTSVSP